MSSPNLTFFVIPRLDRGISIWNSRILCVIERGAKRPKQSLGILDLFYGILEFIYGILEFLDKFSIGILEFLVYKRKTPLGILDFALEILEFPASLRGSKATEARNSRFILRNSKF